MQGQHLYTMSTSERPSGWNLEGVGWFAFAAQPSLPPPNHTIPLYRWYNSANTDHFYTSDPKGEKAPQDGYHSEGITCWIFDPAKPPPAGSVPLYRFVRTDGSGVHFYTISTGGENLAGYASEGSIGFVYPQYVGGTGVVLRWLNPVEGGGPASTDQSTVQNIVNGVEKGFIAVLGTVLPLVL
jgi:hypothetical protein